MGVPLRLRWCRFDFLWEGVEGGLDPRWRFVDAFFLKVVLCGDEDEFGRGAW